jgi:hypothetical protein
MRYPCGCYFGEVTEDPDRPGYDWHVELCDEHRAELRENLMQRAHAPLN